MHRIGSLGLTVAVALLLLAPGLARANDSESGEDGRVDPRRGADAQERPELPTTVVGEIPLGVGRGAPSPRFSRDGRWMVLPRGMKRDPLVSGWSHAAFTLVDLEGGVVAHHEDGISSGPQSPVFDRASRWVAWGERLAPARLRVHVRALRDGETTTFDVTHRAGRGYAVLAAISESGRRVAVVEPEDARRRRSLVVAERGREAPHARRENFAGLSHGTHRFAVALVGRFVIHHTRVPDRGAGGDYRLAVFDVEAQRDAALLGAWASRETPRFVPTPSGDGLLNGNAAYELEMLDLETLETRVLANVRPDLYSHWLELTADATGRRLVAWSDERRRVVVIDLADARRHVIDRPGRLRVLGLGPAGERLVLVQGKGTLEVIDVRSGRVLAARSVEKHRVALDPTGTCLVTSWESSKGWSLRLERIEWDGIGTQGADDE